MRCPQCNLLLQKGVDRCSCGHRFPRSVDLSRVLRSGVAITLLVTGLGFLLGWLMADFRWAFLNIGSERNVVTPVAIFWLLPPFFLAGVPGLRRHGGCWQAVLYPLAFLVGLSWGQAIQGPRQVREVPREHLSLNGLRPGMSLEEAERAFLRPQGPSRRVSLYSSSWLTTVVEEGRVTGLSLDAWRRPELGKEPSLPGKSLKEAKEIVPRLTYRGWGQPEDGLLWKVHGGAVLASLKEGKLEAVWGTSLDNEQQKLTQLGSVWDRMTEQTLGAKIIDEVRYVPLGNCDIYIHLEGDRVASLQMERKVHNLPAARMYSE